MCSPAAAGKDLSAAQGAGKITQIVTQCLHHADELFAHTGEKREELLPAALQCTEPAELRELAAQHGIALNTEEAERLLGLIRDSIGELTDSELDAVTGGALTGTKCPRCWLLEAKRQGPSRVYPGKFAYYCPKCGNVFFLGY